MADAARVHPAGDALREQYTDPNMPPMGLRLRLKASYDICGYTGQSRAVLEALKTYGMIVADNGSSWMITGAADPRWDDRPEQIKRCRPARSRWWIRGRDH